LSRADDRDVEGGVEVALELPTAFESLAELARLRRNAFESVGAPYAGGILYGIGLSQGMLDGLRVARRFASTAGGTPRHAGAGLPLLFAPGKPRADGGFQARLAGSVEVELHCEDGGEGDAPVCHVSAGYGAGWYSALFGGHLLVRETRCVALGARACEFDARPVEAWLAAKDTWATDQRAYLDFDAMRAAAEKKLAESEDELAEGGMLGAFDPLSPAVHVWGPVMVLPYSGAGDSIEAIETILADVGPDAVRVVVLDVTGASLDALESAGVLRVLATLDERKLEAVLAGIATPPAGGDWLSRARAECPPLRARDVTEAIALAFQLARTR
jgi:hypothetical protein